MNTEITQTDIASFHTSRPDDNIIPAQFQMPRMGRQRGVNDGVQIKTYTFSKRDIIRVNYQVLSQLSQLLFLHFCI